MVFRIGLIVGGLLRAPKRKADAQRGSSTYHDRGMYFASHGYVFLTVDVRGRGDSGGSFTPLLQEANDGPQVVEWLARQPYCNGKVAMWGGSYAGYRFRKAKESHSDRYRRQVPDVLLLLCLLDGEAYASPLT